MTATINDTPLDEVQWSSPQLARQHGIHENSILHYFSESPWFDRTSNNAVIVNQAQFNSNMVKHIQTREAMELRLREMAGLEFVVGEKPKEMGPGAVWVINKQTRRKRPGEEDEVTVHACYFVVGINIYMAPTMADILSSRIATISSAISKVQPLAESVRTWTPSSGHVYQQPTTSTDAKPSRGGQSKEGTPVPDGLGKSRGAQQKGTKIEFQRLAEESFAIHMKYGGDYLDENPITGRPGEFHLSSTGRKEKLTAVQLGQGPLAVDTKPVEPKKDGGKNDKTPKTPTMGKPKRRKSKAGAAASAS